MNNKFLKIALAILSCLFLSLSVSSQGIKTDAKTELLLCNKWKLYKKVRNSFDLPIKQDSLKNGLIFYKNYQCESLSRGASELGKWKYESKKREIKINFDSGSSLIMKVIKITNDTLRLNVNLNNDDYVLTLISQS